MRPLVNDSRPKPLLGHAAWLLPLLALAEAVAALLLR